MSKPVWVHVYWSESRRFKENELVPFAEFEKRAKAAAMRRARNVPAMQSYTGYYKTMVNVLFDDGKSYECRLDLAPLDTLGFEHHACKLMSWYECHSEDENYSASLYKDNYEFLKQVVFPVSQ